MRHNTTISPNTTIKPNPTISHNTHNTNITAENNMSSVDLYKYSKPTNVLRNYVNMHTVIGASIFITSSIFYSTLGIANIIDIHPENIFQIVQELRVNRGMVYNLITQFLGK